ncbi:MAG: TonB-dependent receptor [Alistipes sp.]|nr:TonB-dependent receptor [Alistipes sp.]
MNRTTLLSDLRLRLFIALLFVVVSTTATWGYDTANPPRANAAVMGRIVDGNGEAVAFASIYIKGTARGATADADGNYYLKVVAGNMTLCASMLGYEEQALVISVEEGEEKRIDITLEASSTDIDEVVVTASGVGRVKRSAFNAVALDTHELRNSTKSISDALSKAPGLKLRESGGVGSDLALTVDGFSGKHVKVFIDGVPQEGVGSSFSLNNIPAGFAERIEVYRGVVPVGFGSDAIGGVVNIVTNKSRRRWFADASYSFGSFNTHRSTLNAGQTLENGFMWEINAFQNYSDNNYTVDAPVEDFETGRIDKLKKERVERFHDTYHNEAVVAKVGITEKRWADRLVFGFTYSQMYKEIQTGVRQEIVYGEKLRRSHSLMPSIEYQKRNLFVDGLDLTITANYNRNITYNIDTAQYKYNWHGEQKRLNSPGEQSYQHTRSTNDNWNATATLNYRLGRAHTFTLNHVFNTFKRSNTSLLAKEEQDDAIDKQTMKNITGLQYRLMPSKRWNLSLFGKYYNIDVAGPVATNDKMTEFVRTTRKDDALGYGIAGTYFILPSLQAKLSYEKAYRLPTIEEMFGDEDLEMGDVGIRPENSDNLNFNISYNALFGQSKEHGIYIEAGLIFRNTDDYIQRNIVDMSGGKSAASYINYGRVKTWGGNLSLRYTFAKWLSVGGNLTYMDVRDNMPIALGTTSMPNLGYKDRMPNIPYLFADADITFTWHDCIWKEDTLSLTYDNNYLNKFYYYSSRIGTNKDEFMVPTQFSHNLTLSYSIKGGRYNFAIECRNLTNEKLYDNFSLQKAGRAFYGKIRIAFGGR